MKYKISGALKSTGTDVTIIVEAENAQIAESIAFKQGILISKVEQCSKESSIRFPLWVIIIITIVCLVSLAVKDQRTKSKEAEDAINNYFIQLREQKEQEEINKSKEVETEAFAPRYINIAQNFFNLGAYQESIDLCRKVMKDFPNTKYATEAQMLLRQMPKRFRAPSNITDQELGL